MQIILLSYFFANIGPFSCEYVGALNITSGLYIPVIYEDTWFSIHKCTRAWSYDSCYWELSCYLARAKSYRSIPEAISPSTKQKKKREKKCLILSYRSSGIDLIVSSHSASQVGWCFQEEGGLTQCFMLVIHLFGKLGSGRALGTCPSMIFRRVSGMSGVFLVHAGEELRGRGPTLLQGCWYVLSGLHCPCNMVYKEVPVSALPLHLCGSRMP